MGKIVYWKWGWGPLGSTSPMSLQIGIAQQALVLLAITGLLAVSFKKNVIFQFIVNLLNRSGFTIQRKLERIDVMHFVFFLILLLTSVFLMTRGSLFLWNSFSLLSFVLYPWRFLAIAVFACAALAAYAVKVTKPNLFLIILFLGLLLYSNRNYSQLVGKVYEKDSYYYNYQDTADIWGEYLPTAANLEIIKMCRMQGCKFEKIIVPDDLRAEVVVSQSNVLKASYESPRDFTATINTFYFPGWNLYIDNLYHKGIEVNENGTMDISLPKGKHELMLRFEDTSFRKTALLVSLVGMLCSGIYALWLKKYLKS